MKATIHVEVEITSKKLFVLDHLSDELEDEIITKLYDTFYLTDDETEVEHEIEIIPLNDQGRILKY